MAPLKPNNEMVQKYYRLNRMKAIFISFLLRSSAVRNQRCPMCGEAPQLEEVEFCVKKIFPPKFAVKLFSFSPRWQIGSEEMASLCPPSRASDQNFYLLHLHFFTVYSVNMFFTELQALKTTFSHQQSCCKYIINNF